MRHRVSQLIAAGVIGGGGGAVEEPWVPGALLIGDSFTAADGTAIAGRTPDIINQPGNVWLAETGLADIRSNRATMQTSAARYIIDSGVQNCILQFSFTIGQTSGANNFVQAIVRYANASNFLAITAGLVTSSFWGIQEKISDTTLTRASAAYTFANNTTYILSVTINGANVSATINGGTAIAYASVVAAGTKQGFVIAESDTITNKSSIDDYQVYAI